MIYSEPVGIGLSGRTEKTSNSFYLYREKKESPMAERDDLLQEGVILEEVEIEEVEQIIAPTAMLTN